MLQKCNPLYYNIYYIIKCTSLWLLWKKQERQDRFSLTRVTASANSNSIDGCRHRGWWVEREVSIFTAMLMPASTYSWIPGALPPIEAVIWAITLVVMQVGNAWWRGVGRRARSRWGQGRRRCRLVVMVRPGRRRPFQWVSLSLLQVVEPECQSSAVFRGGGGVDEGVGKELPRLLQVMAVLDRVGQDARQQAHVFSLSFNVSRFEQRKMGKDEGDDTFLGLTLPLANYTCRTKWRRKLKKERKKKEKKK